MSKAEFENRMLAEISLETELRIQDMTMLLLQIQELSNTRSELFGCGIEPSTKLVLFFIEREISMERLQEA